MRTNKEKTDRLESALINVANLIGAPGTNEKGEPFGLNMLKEEKECRDKAGQIHNGLFITQVMGCYNSGKSSIINALIKQQVLPSLIRPTTAILTILQYGEKNECSVHYKAKQSIDGELIPGEVIDMTIEEFQKMYSYTDDDDREYQNLGYVERFSVVDYAVVKVNSDLLKNSNRLLDCPGLRNNIVDNSLAMEMAKKANAIIYVGTADKAGFDMNDKEYFSENFGVCPNNVFFLINKFDICRNEEERNHVKSKVEFDLAPYFTNVDGVVDKELMSRRIFYVSAHYAIDSFEGQRLNEYDEMEKLSERQCKNLYDKSGFGGLVKELEHYLNTDSRNMIVYMNSLKYLQDVQKKAQMRVDEDKVIYENKTLLSEEEYTKINSAIDSMELKITSTHKCINMWTVKFQNQFSNILRDSVQKIDDTWEQDILEIADRTKFSFAGFLRFALKQMNFFKNKDQRSKEIDKMLEPFSEAVAVHISKVITKNVETNMPYIEHAIGEAEKEIGSSVSDIKKMFLGLPESFLSDGTKMGAPQGSFIQQVVALYFGDLSELMANAGSGKRSWIEFIKRILINSMWQWAVLVVLTGPLAPIVILAIEMWQMKKVKDSHAVMALNNAKKSIMSSIHTNLERMIAEKNMLLLKEMEKIKESLCKDNRMQLESEKARLHKLHQDMSNMSFSHEVEMERCYKILDRLQIEIQQTSEYIFPSSSYTC